MAIAFSGWADPKKALSDSANVLNKLPAGANKYISLGGGNINGHFTVSTVYAIADAINSGKFSAYNGIAYDIEEGDSNMEDAFRQSFAAAKATGLKVLVTVRHSAPYRIGDAVNLMRSFFSSSNIDILSPQLYTTGAESYNQYDTTAGVQWSEYCNAKAITVPSIVNSNLYGDWVGYMSSQGVTVSGYVQCAQV